MKLIKTLATMAIINAVGVVALIGFSFPTSTTGLPSVIPTASYAPQLNSDVMASPISVIPTPTPAQVGTTATPQSSRIPATTATPAPTVQPTPLPTPAGCIVTIDSVKYDVTRLQFTHSGGDIFNCGADMSQTFWSRHNNRILQRMQQYKI